MRAPHLAPERLSEDEATVIHHLGDLARYACAALFDDYAVAPPYVRSELAAPVPRYLRAERKDVKVRVLV